MKNTVIFIDNRFGYQKGGCSTFNYELCMALRQITMEDVDIVAVIINCSQEDRVRELEIAAENLGIHVIDVNISNNPNEMINSECQQVLSVVCSQLAASEDIHQEKMIWVGHDIFTGEYAIRMATYGGGRSVICIHTDYDTIEGLKGVNREGIIKENRQRKIIQSADIVFAVGPRLLERVQEIRTAKVYELIPGMPVIDDEEIYNERAVIVYGRFEEKVAQVKQAYLALAAFGRAIAIMNNNKDYVLHIIGSPQNDKKEEQLRAIAERYAEGRKLSINFQQYTQDRQYLFDCIKNNCAGLMVSISEGFGMVGWEMIAAGLPLILTKKSGLYDYLDRRFGYMLNGMCLPVDLKGSSIENLREEDVQAVSERIVTVFKNPKKLRTAARELKRELKDETWYSTASNFAKNIGIESVKYGTVEIYSDTYKARKDSLEEILNELEAGRIGKKCLIFFGGISKMLCEERAIAKINRWLSKDTKRQLFLCYESGKAAHVRANELDKDTLQIDDGLSKSPVERMEQKEKLVKESYYKYSDNVKNQIVYVKLVNSPLTYTVIVDQHIYFTVLLQTRSSESMTMKIDEQYVDERRKIIESMEFVLNKQDKENGTGILLDKLEEYKRDYL